MSPSRGYWTPAGRGIAPVVANAEEVALAWLQWKVGVKNVKPNTRGNLARSMARFFKSLRVVLGTSPDSVVPSTALTTANVGKTIKVLRESGYADGTLYQTVAAVVDMWTWAADPEEGFDVPPPPRNLDRVMPEPAIYVAPEEDPTWSECDACIRRIGRRARGQRPLDALRLAVIMRYTGLRIEQAAVIHRKDIDLAAGTLLVRKGKTRQEQAGSRKVPVSPHLLRDLGAWLTTAQNGPLFPDEADPSLPIRSYRNQTRYVTDAWKAASAAGEARQSVWNPPSRRKARPDHAFRAAIQAELENLGFSDAVVDRLVGHAPSGTRRKHYAKASERAVNAAVQQIAPIDWSGAVAHPLEGVGGTGLMDGGKVVALSAAGAWGDARHR